MSILSDRAVMCGESFQAIGRMYSTPDCRLSAYVEIDHDPTVSFPLRFVLLADDGVPWSMSSYGALTGNDTPDTLAWAKFRVLHGQLRAAGVRLPQLHPLPPKTYQGDG